MTDTEKVMIAAASFEDRSTVRVQKFLDSGGRSEHVFIANVFERGEMYRQNLDLLKKLGVRDLDPIDRFSSHDLWSWTWDVVERACTPNCNLLIDITCLPRELLGMLLFAVSIKRSIIDRVSVAYVSAPEGGYATQNEDLPESQRWLSKGVSTVRSIIGFPGVFRSERPSRLVILAGHELDRISKIIEHVEPSHLTIDGEQEKSSTVVGAGNLSRKVAGKLRDRIQIPKIDDIKFSSSSIEGVFENLINAELENSDENISLVAVNTKLSFVGAALFALCQRTVRMIYAVPQEYNPLYCRGVGNIHQFDITKLVQRATTETM